MSKSDTWMPLHIGDYLADTGHLRTVEHGAYVLLLMHYWRNGPLPAEPAKLASISRLSRKEWDAIEPTIADFFTIADGRWRQKRADAERTKATELSDKRRAVAEARWGSKREQPTSNSYAIAPPIAEQTTVHARAHHLNNNIPSVVPLLRNGHVPPDGLFEEPSAKPRRQSPRTRIPDDWRPDEKGLAFAAERGVNVRIEAPKFRDHHKSKGNLMADWGAAWRTWCQSEWVTKLPPPPQQGRSQLSGEW